MNTRKSNQQGDKLNWMFLFKFKKYIAVWRIKLNTWTLHIRSLWNIILSKSKMINADHSITIKKFISLVSYKLIYTMTYSFNHTIQRAPSSRMTLAVVEYELPRCGCVTLMSRVKNKLFKWLWSNPNPSSNICASLVVIIDTSNH